VAVRMCGWHEYCFYNWVRCALGTILAGGDCGMVFVGMNLAGGDLLHKVRYDSCIWHGSCIYPDSYVGRGWHGSCVHSNQAGAVTH
jgi:hypothetical protein